MISEISGFSKLSKIDKIKWIESHPSIGEDKIFERFWLSDNELQKVFDEFSENTISNFILPMGISPNYLINGKMYAIPMVIEESSVVAAASNAAKFWMTRGGFKAEILGTEKLGHVHFEFSGEKSELNSFFNKYQNQFLEEISDLEKNMKSRGGGVTSLELIDSTSSLENYFKLEAKFETCNAMGANFINTVLERFAKSLSEKSVELKTGKLQVIMSILSNFTPSCLVKVSVKAKTSELDNIIPGLSGIEFAEKFVRAVKIARNDVTRAVTHNKGIMNGVDAVVIATGNDFRAIEACTHAYAARDGKYRSLSEASLSNDEFSFELTLPLALGTVGGLTSLHPLSKKALEILGNPNSDELMQIIGTVGLAQNFAAVKSLITTGIQKGHMKMHLLNILNQLGATPDEITKTKIYFIDKVVSFGVVRDFLGTIRVKH